MGGVDGGEVDDAEADVAAVVDKLGSYGLEEPAAGELGGAVGGLQGNADEGQGGADVDDVAPVSVSQMEANTVVMAYLTHTSIGPSSVSARPAVASSWS